MAANGIIKQEAAAVKAEAHTVPISTFMDEDDFEDTGELTIPPDVKVMWLMRIPRILWETWATADDDEELQIGNIRVWQGQKEGQEQKVGLLLLSWSLCISAVKEIPQDIHAFAGCVALRHIEPVQVSNSTLLLRR